MAYEDRPGRYGGRVPYGGPPRRDPSRRPVPQTYRGRYPPPPERLRRAHLREQSFVRRRGRADAIELPPTLIDRLGDPSFVGTAIPYVGIATFVVSMIFLILYAFEVTGGLLYLFFVAGASGIILTGIGSFFVMFKGGEDESNKAYLGLGLSIGSFIWLSAGAVLSWF